MGVGDNPFTRIHTHYLWWLITYHISGMSGGSPIDRDEDNEESELIQTYYDWEETAPSTAVVETVAFATHRELRALPLLYEVVDPKALDTMFTSPVAVQAKTPITISFIFAGCSVRVQSSGEVRVRPATRSQES